MSHSHFFKTENHHYTFIFNGDYSGSATIIKQVNTGQEHPSFRHDTEEKEEEFEVDCTVLRDFVLGMFRDEMIRKVENMSDDELFKHLSSVK